MGHFSPNRTDIKAFLPYGSMVKIAESCDCSKSHVSAVLSGKKEDKNGIIKAAEGIASIYAWKTKHCKLGYSKL